MHSIHYLNETDFVTGSVAGPGAASGLDSLAKRWRAEDRVAIVAPDAHAGITGCGGAVLLLTQWFYAREAAARPGFFDYPQHYAIVGEAGARTRHLGPDEHRRWSAAWCRLDVWPATHHIVAEPTPEALMLAVLAVEPRWLFWPATLTPPGAMRIAGGGDDRVVRSLLRARLRGVVLYGDSGDGAADQWSIECSGGAAALLAEGLEALPGSTTGHVAAGARSWFRTLPVEAFLAAG